MFEQVNIIYGDIVDKLTVMMRCYSENKRVTAQQLVKFSLARQNAEALFPLKVRKSDKKFAISTFKVNNSQQIEQFSALIIKAKDIYIENIFFRNIKRENIEQDNEPFSCLNVAQE